MELWTFRSRCNTQACVYTTSTLSNGDKSRDVWGRWFTSTIVAQAGFTCIDTGVAILGDYCETMDHSMVGVAE